MAAKGKPNILVIWGDDIGWFNVSAYNHGIMGYRTPNIDRIAREGMIFRNAFVANSICTPSRATVLTGKHSHLNGAYTIFGRVKRGLPSLARITQGDVIRTIRME